MCVICDSAHNTECMISDGLCMLCDRANRITNHEQFNICRTNGCNRLVTQLVSHIDDSLCQLCVIVTVPYMLSLRPCVPGPHTVVMPGRVWVHGTS